MKKETIIIVTLPILCAIAAILAYVKLINTDVDAAKFKKEYEELNENGIELNIDENIRGENLSLEQFAEISNKI